MFLDLDTSPEGRPVLVLGAASIDIVGRLESQLEPGTSTPAHIRTSYGGTARNVAENLARLGHPVTLLTAIGRETIGRQLLRYTEKAGVSVDHVIQSKKVSTGSYLAVVNHQGELQFALDDMDAISLLTPSYLEERAGLFAESALMFVDANLQEDTLETAMRLAKEANLPVAADPTSTLLTGKLIPYLDKIALITPNHKEAAILCSRPVSQDDRQIALEAAKHLVSLGADFTIITLAEFGVTYATSETSGHIPAIRTRIVDPTGAGDALIAAVIFALLNGIPEDEAVRLGVSAASLTLHHPGAVRPDLSLELLYDKLI